MPHFTFFRQSFFKHETVPTYAKLAHMLKDTPEFRALPQRWPKGLRRQVCGAWDTFWKAHICLPAMPGKFTGRPKLPHYKPKLNGRNLLVYTRQAISQPALKEGRSVQSQLNLVIQKKTQGGTASSDRSACISLCRRSDLHGQTQIRTANKLNLLGGQSRLGMTPAAVNLKQAGITPSG